jgi:hypothetical protein
MVDIAWLALMANILQKFMRIPKAVQKNASGWTGGLK